MAGQGLTKRSTWKTTPPQYNPRAEGLLEQNDPRPKGAGKMQRKLNKVRFESRPRKRQRPMPEKDDDPIIVAYSDAEEEVDPIIIVAGLEGDEQKDQEGEHTREEESPQSPPEEEKGSLPYAYTPRSPPYPPPEDEDWETESMPELVDIDEDQDTVIVPADQNADKDFFQDSERQSAVKQKYESEIKQAPWNPQANSENPLTNPQANSENPLTKLGDLIPKATPVYKGFWKNSDVDILSRLDAASEELKSKRRSKTQKETPEESSPNGQDKIDEIDVEDPHPDRPESPSLLTSTRDNLEDTISNAPVEPVTPQMGPPKVIPPMPYSEHDITVSPPQIPTNFRIKLKSVAKMRTGPPPQKAKMLVDLVTQPTLIIKKLTPRKSRSCPSHLLKQLNHRNKHHHQLKLAVHELMEGNHSTSSPPLKKKTTIHKDLVTKLMYKF